LDYLCKQNKEYNYEEGIFDTAISHITGQLQRKERTDSKGSDESENTGSITWYGG
jgi:hypothetical protein